MATANQIAFWNNQETMRANRAREEETMRHNTSTESHAWANLAETRRSNLANEAELRRSHLVNEGETRRSNLARETETYRSNVAREGETRRSNLMNEAWRNYDTNAKFISSSINSATGLTGNVIRGVTDVATTLMKNKANEDSDWRRVFGNLAGSMISGIMNEAFSNQQSLGIDDILGLAALLLPVP